MLAAFWNAIRVEVDFGNRSSACQAINEWLVTNWTPACRPAIRYQQCRQCSIESQRHALGTVRNYIDGCCIVYDSMPSRLAGDTSHGQRPRNKMRDTNTSALYLPARLSPPRCHRLRFSTSIQPLRMATFCRAGIQESRAGETASIAEKVGEGRSSRLSRPEADAGPRGRFMLRPTSMRTGHQAPVARS